MINVPIRRSAVVEYWWIQHICNVRRISGRNSAGECLLNGIYKCRFVSDRWIREVKTLVYVMRHHDFDILIEPALAQESPYRSWSKATVRHGPIA